MTKLHSTRVPNTRQFRCRRRPRGKIWADRLLRVLSFAALTWEAKLPACLLHNTFSSLRPSLGPNLACKRLSRQRKRDWESLDNMQVYMCPHISPSHIHLNSIPPRNLGNNLACKRHKKPLPPEWIWALQRRVTPRNTRSSQQPKVGPNLAA